MIEITRPEAERLYRLVADNAPREEALELIFDLFGKRAGLRPPAQEIQLARNCGTERRANG